MADAGMNGDKLEDGMRGVAPGLMALGVGLLAGCGAQATPSSNGSTSPAAWHSILVARAESIHQLAASVAVEQVYSGAPAPVTASVKMNGEEFTQNVLTSNGQDILVVDNGQTVYTYASGDVAYGITSSWAPDGYDVSWMTTQYVNLLRHVTFVKVHTLPNNLITILWTGTLPTEPSPETANGSLVYDTQTRAPESLTAHVGGGSVHIRVARYNTSPTFTASTFRFSPPSNTLGMDASSTILQTLNTVASSLAYTVAVPSQRSGLQLERVGAVDSHSYGREIVMQFAGSAGGPLLVTEYTGKLKPPLPASTSPAQIDGHPVTEATIGTNEEIVLSDQKTTVLAEGQPNDLTNLVTHLTTLPAPAKTGT